MQIYADYSGRLDPNCYTQGRDGKSVLVLVCHNTAGPHDFNPGNQALSDAAALYLTSNDRQVSIHWVVGAEAAGAPIYRVVPEDSIAYHAGGTSGYPSRWVNPDDGAVYGRYGLNEVSIGIELFGNEKDPVGPNQLAALKALVLDIARRFPIIARPGHIVAHAELEGDRTDGRNWVNLAKGWVAQISSGGASAPQGVPTLDNTDPNGDPGVWHCTLTDKWVTNDEGFLSFHRQHGGVSIFGLPITGAYTDPTNPDQVIQWFERARFERHADGNTYLGLVGAELYARL